MKIKFKIPIDNLHQGNNKNKLKKPKTIRWQFWEGLLVWWRPFLITRVRGVKSLLFGFSSILSLKSSFFVKKKKKMFALYTGNKEIPIIPENFIGLVLLRSKKCFLSFFFSYSLILGWILIFFKKCFDNRAYPENLDLLHFLQKFDESDSKKVFKIIPNCASGLCIYIYIYIYTSRRKCTL